MSCFKLPKTLIKDLHRLIARFWWGSNDGDRQTHWGKWVKLCQPKEDGGLNFRDLESFNKALLAKQCWKLIREPDSLIGRVLKASYFKKSCFLEAKIGSKPSYVWRIILWGKGDIEAGSKWHVGSSESFDVVKDRWIPIPYSFKIFDHPILPKGFRVSDLRLPCDIWDS
ncbi:hypothetical protein UlMin_045972 [Ulmus minor]